MILSIDEVGEILDQLMEELPEGILDGLNGGVNLSEEERRPEGKDGDTMLLLGEYIASSAMGYYINIYYGSFLASFSRRPKEEWVKQLRETLHHEITHHLERRAGCRDLEIEDEIQKRQLRTEAENRAALRLRRRRGRRDSTNRNG